jgi:hypothetical protein
MRAVDAAICSKGGSINEPIAAGMASGFPFSATSRQRSPAAQKTGYVILRVVR